MHQELQNPLKIENVQKQENQQIPLCARHESRSKITKSPQNGKYLETGKPTKSLVRAAKLQNPLKMESVQKQETQKIPGARGMCRAAKLQNPLKMESVQKQENQQNPLCTRNESRIKITKSPENGKYLETGKPTKSLCACGMSRAANLQNPLKMESVQKTNKIPCV